MIFEVLVREYLDAPEKNVLFSLVNDFEDGGWRYPRFQSYIWDNIGETSLTFKERASLVNHSFLAAAAKNLRLTDEIDTVGEGSELAEIVLYGIMKDYYKAISVVPKIFYKQNSKDNAKGSDSVHIVLEGDNEFSLWFGESKFYNSIENARLRKVIESVGNSLNTEKLRKENSIITNLSELNTAVQDDQLRERILHLLSEDTSIDEIKPRLHVPILLLHECELTSACTEMSDDYRSKVMDHHRERATHFFAKQAEDLKGIHKFSDITFHIILLPVPSKSEIVKRFVEGVRYFKGQN